MADFLSFSTHEQCEMIDVTAELEALVVAKASNGSWQNGFLAVYSQHTTCGLTINEGYDPDVRQDITSFFSKLVPTDCDFHHSEGNSDAHIKTSLFGSSVLVPVENGHLALGRWQAVYLCESDGPRMRTIRINFFAAG